MNHELRTLTSARGVAAWFVVFFHLRKSIAGLPDWAMAVFARGYLAVDFFFLLSGFVIWLSYGKRIREEGLAAVPRFLHRRVARIWPLHLAMLGFAAALALLLAATGHASAHFPWHELPLHLLLVQNWGLTDHLAWNDPAWSISCELAAYLLFPLLALTIDWRRLPGWAVVGAIAALILLLHLLFAASGATALGQAIPTLGVPRCLIEFSAGGAVGALWLRWRDRPRIAAPLSAGTAIGLCAGWWLGLPETLAAPAVFAATLLALALVAGRSGNPLERRAIHYLGEISYATYLSHYLLWTAFKLVLVEDASAVSWPMIALFLLLTLGASAALYHLIERPAQRWVNGLRPARAAPRVSPPTGPRSAPR